MIRLGALLMSEALALALMLSLKIDVPWFEPASLVQYPEELVAAGLIRLVAIGIVGWLLVSTVLYAAAAPNPRIRTAVGRWTAPLVRRLVDTALAATLAVTLAGPAAAAEAPPDPVIVTTSGAVFIPPGAAVAVPVTAPDTPPPTHEPVPTLGAPVPARVPSPERTAVGALQPAITEAAMFQAAPDTYEVQPGDHLWSIAEEVLQAQFGRQAIADHEIAPYWVRLIDTNVESLRSGDPDLIYPGEVLVIPEVAS